MTEPAEVDNIEQTDDNMPDVPGAAVNTAEDTPANIGAAYAEVIDAKDQIIDFYKGQVESLKNQINELVRNGAIITDGTKPNEPEPPKEPQRRKEAYEMFSDLGKEIGR